MKSIAHDIRQLFTASMDEFCAATPGPVDLDASQLYAKITSPLSPLSGMQPTLQGSKEDSEHRASLEVELEGC